MKYISVEEYAQVYLIRLSGPKNVNTLSMQLIEDLNAALDIAENKKEISVIVITGNGKGFCPGGDISEMSEIDNCTIAQSRDWVHKWERIGACKKPVIAAVKGYALGGGCELAMMCDIILATPETKFSQPEVFLGTLPGAGGTQRLTRTIGKYKAMDLCLTGRAISAIEAEKIGLVSRIVDKEEDLEKEAIILAQAIAAHSLPVIQSIKACIQMALETNLSQGIKYERQAFYSSFSLNDQKEGMCAFLEKRKPNFTNQ